LYGYQVLDLATEKVLVLFNDFMRGQTYTADENMVAMYYEDDVRKFVNGLTWQGRVTD